MVCAFNSKQSVRQTLPNSYTLIAPSKCGKPEPPTEERVRDDTFPSKKPLSEDAASCVNKLGNYPVSVTSKTYFSGF